MQILTVQCGHIIVSLSQTCFHELYIALALCVPSIQTIWSDAVYMLDNSTPIYLPKNNSLVEHLRITLFIDRVHIIHSQNIIKCKTHNNAR